MEQNTTNIHWFPGHMMKTLRLIEASIRSVDAVAELVDARLPYSSKNPELARLTAGKPRLVLLNKSDLADAEKTRRWLAFYRAQGYGALALQAKGQKSGQQLVEEIRRLVFAGEGQASKKVIGKPRVMVVGVPNVGKSTFINLLAGTTRARAEDRPGVTRGKQWITLPQLELLDMPGVLWKKLENQQGARKLAFTGAIRDEVLNREEVAMCMLDALKAAGYAGRLCERFKLTGEQLENLSGFALLEAAGRGRGMLMARGEIDTERAAAMVLNELRAGKLGRVTFEVPSDYGL